ncbi:hypothetical protein AMD24_00242 [Candidatus Xiphinematobacter sp. Idaho Grape]|uniref:DUF4381 family protein n=1 Tax=Candidatus Xiphinematobacter sp. Idaho Grape TaxID=1704307 RepID=UPI00070622B9|nr:DUF4381 family protein [Candidatus Xiphinematobacter sp. Idaho Grape]ALJ56430.1 hypothetical protein AMD24_00242 [Candidatus Xiphinematobacter sp. Idaho Grape]
MTSVVSSSLEPAPLHDIDPPIPISLYPAWIAPLAILGILVLAALFFCSRKLSFPKRKQLVNPKNAALEALAVLHSHIEVLSPHDFGVEVSALLRRYIQDEYGLRATTQTSVEFLVSIRDSPIFSSEEKIILGKFLEMADLLKFSRRDARRDETSSLLLQAEQLIYMRNRGIAL